MEQNLIKTGTTTLGIICKDGIVIAADKKATAGHFIMDKRAQKIHQIDDAVGLTIAGLVSDAQLLVKLARAEIKLKKLRTGVELTMKEVANMMANLNYSNIRKMSMVPGIVGFLVGGKDHTGYHLYNIGVDGSISEEPEFTSDGSGSVFVYGVLETLYKKDMTIQEGIALAKKSLSASIERDAASGCGIDVATITDKGFELIESKQLPKPQL